MSSLITVNWNYHFDMNSFSLDLKPCLLSLALQKFERFSTLHPFLQWRGLFVLFVLKNESWCQTYFSAAIKQSSLFWIVSSSRLASFKPKLFSLTWQSIRFNEDYGLSLDISTKKATHSDFVASKYSINLEKRKKIIVEML